MTKWDDRVSGHQAVQLLEQLEPKLNDISAPDDSGTAEDLERIKRLVSHLRWLVENVDAQLLTLETLNNLAAPLQSVGTSIDTWIQNDDPQYLDQANQYADQALNVAGPLPFQSGSMDGEGLRRSAESFRRSAGQLVRGLTEEVDAAKERIGEVASELDTKIGALQNATTEIGTTLSQHRQTLDQQLAIQQTAFTEAQQERQEGFDAHTAEQTEQFDKALGNVVEKSEQAVADLQTRATGIVEEMQEQQQKAETLLDAIGRTGTEFGFKEYAEAEKKQANLWRLVAVASLVAIVWIGIWVLVTAHEAKEVNLSLSILKLIVTVPLGALAAYAGRQSHHHRVNEVAARNLHLDIAAIDPYIALLPEPEQHAIKADMARRIFGHRIQVAGDKSAGTVNLGDSVVEEIVKRFPDFGKNPKGTE